MPILQSAKLIFNLNIQRAWFSFNLVNSSFHIPFRSWTLIVVKILCLDLLVAKLLYKSKCPSVRISVCQPRLVGNVIFSAPNWDIAPIFLCRFPSLMSIYSVNILSICLSVMLRKALLLMDVFILVLFIIILSTWNSTVLKNWKVGHTIEISN